MSKRVYNFYAGPATLPENVLKIAQTELLNYQNSGMSIMEMSHRSPSVEKVMSSAEQSIKELLNIPENYRVLFLQGGASSQFFMVPYNFLLDNKVANYLVTGSFAEKAYQEAAQIGQAHIAATTKELKYTRVNTPDEISLSNDVAYVHLTSNNTIYGTQWESFPELNAPLIADMSSDILSRQFDASKFDLIYAGAQKNLGPAGVTIVIISNALLEISAQQKTVPTMLNYITHAQKDSLYNTPSVFPIYIVNLVLEWLKEQGGVAAVEKQNRYKAGLIYDIIDQNDGFYQGHAKRDRSVMNITFRLQNEDLEKKFVQEAADKGLIGLKGHRSVGGIRASVYNAMPVSGCQALADFMINFMKNN